MYIRDGMYIRDWLGCWRLRIWSWEGTDEEIPDFKPEMLSLSKDVITVFKILKSCLVKKRFL